MRRQSYGHNRDAIYFLAPTRAGGWRVVKVLEHGPHHDQRPNSWLGPYASDLAARAALVRRDMKESEPHTVSMDPPTPENNPVGRFQLTPPSATDAEYEFRVIVHCHERVNPERLAKAMYRILDCATSIDIEGTEVWDGRIGQITVLPEKGRTR